MPKNMKKWTDEQIEMLKNEWPNKSARPELAAKLERSVPALRVKYLSLASSNHEEPKRRRSRKGKIAKISAKSAVPAENSLLNTTAAVEKVQKPKDLGRDETLPLKELMDAYFKEQNAAVADTGSLMSASAFIKGMKQMLIWVNDAGYISPSDKNDFLKVLAKYEKKLMWDALREHFVNNQDEE